MSSEIKEKKTAERRIIALGSGEKTGTHDRYEKLPWLVLDDTDGLLLISKNILETCVYDELAAPEEDGNVEVKEIRWDSCALRHHLNLMLGYWSHHVPEKDLMPVGLGSSKEDLVTILSEDELKRYLTSKERIGLGTRLEEEEEFHYVAAPGNWWLRNESAVSSALKAVDENGEVVFCCMQEAEEGTRLGLRPVIRLKADVPVEDYDEASCAISITDLHTEQDDWKSPMYVNTFSGQMIDLEKQKAEFEARRAEADRQNLEFYIKTREEILELWDKYPLEKDPEKKKKLKEQLENELNSCCGLFEDSWYYYEKLNEMGYYPLEEQYLLTILAEDEETLANEAGYAAKMLYDRDPEKYVEAPGEKPEEYGLAYLEWEEKKRQFDIAKENYQEMQQRKAAGWKPEAKFYLPVFEAAYRKLERELEQENMPGGEDSEQYLMAKSMQDIIRVLAAELPENAEVQEAFRRSGTLFEKVLLRKLKAEMAKPKRLDLGECSPGGSGFKPEEVRNICYLQELEQASEKIKDVLRDAELAGYIKLSGNKALMLERACRGEFQAWQELQLIEREGMWVRILLAGHPEIHESFLTLYRDAFLNYRKNTQVEYRPNPEVPITSELEQAALEADLIGEAAVVLLITKKFFTEDNYARDFVLPFALKHHKAILPILCEEGLEEDFSALCPEIENAISVGEKPQRRDFRNFLDQAVKGELRTGCGDDLSEAETVKTEHEAPQAEAQTENDYACEEPLTYEEQLKIEDEVYQKFSTLYSALSTFGMHIGEEDGNFLSHRDIAEECCRMIAEHPEIIYDDNYRRSGIKAEEAFLYLAASYERKGRLTYPLYVGQMALAVLSSSLIPTVVWNFSKPEYWQPEPAFYRHILKEMYQDLNKRVEETENKHTIYVLREGGSRILFRLADKLAQYDDSFLEESAEFRYFDRKLKRRFRELDTADGRRPRAMDSLKMRRNYPDKVLADDEAIREMQPYSILQLLGKEPLLKKADAVPESEAIPSEPEEAIREQNIQEQKPEEQNVQEQSPVVQGPEKNEEAEDSPFEDPAGSEAEILPPIIDEYIRADELRKSYTEKDLTHYDSEDMKRTVLFFVSQPKEHEQLLIPHAMEVLRNRPEKTMARYFHLCGWDAENLEGNLWLHLAEADGLIVLVTKALLRLKGYAQDLALPIAQELEMPVLAVLCEEGLEEEFRQRWPKIPYIMDRGLEKEGSFPYDMLMSMFVEGCKVLREETVK